MRIRTSEQTAEHNALFRALETRRPGGAVVDDPLPKAFLPWRFRLVTVAAACAPPARRASQVIDRRWPGVRPTVVARTRLIDGDHRRDRRQHAAGRDPGRRLRQPRLAPAGASRGVAVFEVDHPDTQRRKQALLAPPTAPTVAHVRFIPTDFDLGSARRRDGRGRVRPDACRHCFLWEGTTNYLVAADASTRRSAGVRKPQPGSHVIFTYINADVLTDPSRYVGAERVFSTLQRANEPMTFGLAPDALAGYLDRARPRARLRHRRRRRTATQAYGAAAKPCTATSSTESRTPSSALDHVRVNRAIRGRDHKPTPSPGPGWAALGPPFRSIPNPSKTR